MSNLRDVTDANSDLSIVILAEKTQTEMAAVVEMDTNCAETSWPSHATEIDIEAQVLRSALVKIGFIQKEEKKSGALYEETNCSGCFYRCSCNSTNCCVPVVNLKPSMLKTQAIGRELLKEKVFPLFSTNGHEVWTYVQFLLVLGFVLKCAVIDIAVNSPSNRTPVDFASLASSLAFLLFSIKVTPNRSN